MKIRACVLALTLLMISAVVAVAQTTNGLVEASSNGQNISKVLPMGPAQIAVGQGILMDPLAETVGGDCVMTGLASFTCTKTNGVGYGTAATVNTGTSGATIPLNNGANVFSALNTFTGHVAAGATPPTLTSCGTSPAIVGDDKDGQVTMGTGSPTGCVITFVAAYTAVPLCVVTWQATPLASQSYAVATGAITLTQTGTSSNKVNYHCAAQNGG